VTAYPAGELLQVVCHERARDHVELVAEKHRVGMGEPAAQHPRRRDLVVDHGRERELKEKADAEEHPVVASGGPDEKQEEREDQVHLHGHEQEVQVVASGSGYKISSELAESVW
jgi:hypothetical protein